MTNTTKYWIWLSLSIGTNNKKQKRVFETYDSIIDFYSGGIYEWRLSGIFSEKEINSLISTKLSDAQEVIDKCKKLGFDIICFDDSNYPSKLLNIPDPPCVLYVWGKLPDVDHRLSIAMVGTRSATQYGVMTSHVLSASLSKLGVVVVSGGAQGIDTASHLGVLEASGATICVLGCGIDYKYLMSNASLRKNISSTGAVISEYPPGTKSYPSNFPVRNRIISGLSDGVIVVEADLKSGSLITVNHALEQGREVFAVMGNINSRYSSGTNKMIKDGAIPVTSYMDVIEAFPQYKIKSDDVNIELSGQNNTELNNAPVLHKDNLNLSQTVERIYRCIGNEPIHIDEIVAKTDLPVSKVLQSLTELELLSLISCQQGRLYKLA
ncbi:MAG: DNA-processing protein DprA [Eubacteriales bacterium]|nr:DNA-processing protein DprA [Eubacteriales bacterium]